jgi:hypothetical protein
MRHQRLAERKERMNTRYLAFALLLAAALPCQGRWIIPGAEEPDCLPESFQLKPDAAAAETARQPAPCQMAAGRNGGSL